MQPCPGERSAPHSLVLTVRASHDKFLACKGPQHAAEITGVNSQATTKLANFGTVVSNLPKQSSLVHWPTTLEKPVADGTDALRNCSVETADFLIEASSISLTIVRDYHRNFPKQVMPAPQ